MAITTIAVNGKRYEVANLTVTRKYVEFRTTDGHMYAIHDPSTIDLFPYSLAGNLKEIDHLIFG